MGSLVGDIVTTLLILIHIVMDKKQGRFRGLWLQILGAVCVGWSTNLLLNVSSAPMNPWGVVICVIVGAILFYSWANLRRRK